MPQYDSSTPLSRSLPPFKYAEKTRPEFIREGILAQLAVPLIAGLQVFIASGVIVWAIGWSVAWAAVASGLAVLGIGYLWYRDHLTEVMRTTEVVEGIDIPQVTAPQQPAVTVWQMPKATGNGLTRGSFEVPEGLLTEWCRTAYREGPLSFNVWVSKFGIIFPGQGRERFTTFRQAWIDKGLGVDAKGNKGLTLTDAGWDFCEAALRMRGLLVEATPPPAQLDAGDPQ